MVPAVALLVPVLASAGALRWFDAGDFDRAAAAAQQELRVDPQSLPALVLLGRAQLATGRALDAVRTLSQATAAAPPSAEAHYRLGQALAIQALDAGMLRRLALAGDIGEAFQRAVELEPDNAEYRWALFEYCRHAPSFLGGGRKNAEHHAALLAKADAARGHRAHGALLWQDGQRAAAEAQFRAAVGVAPDIADHRFALCYFYQDTGHWDDAFAVFEAIAARFPEEAQALFQFGKTAALSGQRLADGAAALRQYLRHTPRAGDPPRAWTHYRLGLIYQRMGDAPSAIRELEAALALDPALDAARKALRPLQRR